MKINPDKSKAVSLAVSKPVCRLRPPEVTSRSRDVNKDGGWANDLPHPYPLIKYANDLLNIQIICK